MAIDQSKLTTGQQQALLAQQAAQSQNAALLAKKQGLLGTKATGQAARMRWALQLRSVWE